MISFWDRFNRLHTKYCTDDKPFGTNNSFLYSAIYKVLWPQQWANRQSIHGYPIKLPTTMPFNRNLTSDYLPALSHDELTGLAILSKKKAREIVSYGEKNYWQICNLPNFKPKPIYKLNWFLVLWQLYKLNKEDNPRTATPNYPAVLPLAFYQKPEYQWFYYRAAGKTPSVLKRILFTTARVISILKWRNDTPNLVLFFSLAHLVQVGENLGPEGRFVLKLTANKIKKEYGNVREMLKYATKDLPAENYESHPWIRGE